MIETGMNYTDRDEHGFFSSNERRHVNNILRLAEKYPEEVTIKIMPEDNEGHILAWIPKRWFKISPPRKLDLTDEQRASIAMRFKGENADDLEDDEIAAEYDANGI